MWDAKQKQRARFVIQTKKPRVLAEIPTAKEELRVRT